jgi:peptidoglycan-associated lipoprotein
MRVQKGFAVVCFVGLCCLTVSGCSRFRRGGGVGGGTDVLTPMDFGTDLVLGERFEDGERVTDVSFEPVSFGYDSYQVSPSETPKIELVADYMRGNPDVVLVVEGHCDERGSREYNMSLGEHRALAVRSYLVGLGVYASRINTRSFGEERPVAEAHDESAWRLNRRGEFALYR